jgi:hypothetical protein
VCVACPPVSVVRYPLSLLYDILVSIGYISCLLPGLLVNIWSQLMFSLVCPGVGNMMPPPNSVLPHQGHGCYGGDISTITTYFYWTASCSACATVSLAQCMCLCQAQQQVLPAAALLCRQLALGVKGVECTVELFT